MSPLLPALVLGPFGSAPGLRTVAEGEVLEHGIPLTCELSPEDAPLGDFGPGRTFYYALESDDSTVFVHAQSEAADLVLQVEDLGELEDLTVHEDDDSGGGTTPCLMFTVRDGLELEVRVAAK